eukprot:comp15618_c0_seq1/m.12745 comp15618_c0_seq1/g.12745  ORF comp15618_c0_seq1/g.12745 comp15618_c0_seq1/m.12745 type:complete len:447 (-) comp15618_c0_seq1:549-1889(-)
MERNAGGYTERRFTVSNSAQRREAVQRWEQENDDPLPPEKLNRKSSVQLPANRVFLDAVRNNDLAEVRTMLGVETIASPRTPPARKRATTAGHLSEKHRQWTRKMSNIDEPTDDREFSDAGFLAKPAPKQTVSLNTSATSLLEEDDLGGLPLQRRESAPNKLLSLRAPAVAIKTYGDLDLNATSAFGMTGLHLCAMRGYEEMADLLLSRGANIDATDDAGWTPLHTAAAYAQKGMLQFLLSRGADPLILSMFGKAAVEIVGTVGITAEMQVMADGSVDMVDAKPEMEGMLYRAMAQGPHKVGSREALDEYKAQLQQELGQLVSGFCAELAALDGNERESLKEDWSELIFECIWLGRVDLVDRLMSLSVADPNACDDRGWSLLHLAMFRNHNELSEKLVKVYGADPTIRTADSLMVTPSELQAAGGSPSLYRQQMRFRRQWMPGSKS